MLLLLYFKTKGNNIYIYNIIIVDYIYDMTRFFPFFAQTRNKCKNVLLDKECSEQCKRYESKYIP